VEGKEMIMQQRRVRNGSSFVLVVLVRRKWRWFQMVVNIAGSLNTVAEKQSSLRISFDTGTMECLPSDIVLDILSRLPVESVLDCKLVCKRLLNLLTHRRHQFAKMHHQHQLFQLAASYGDASSSSTGLLFSFENVRNWAPIVCVHAQSLFWVVM
ncbi:hypothetical protein C5167_032250, partial [Papaver somniferum]